MPGLDPPAGPKPLRRGEGRGIHAFRAPGATWMAGTSPAMTESVPFFVNSQGTLDIAGVTLLADLSGALFWEDESLLVVSALHLAKGSSFATRGVLLPPYDTAAA